MTKDIDKKESSEISKPEHDYFGDFADAVLVNRIVGDLFLFSKFGDFQAGRAREQVPLGTQVIGIMSQLLTGWVRWEDNRPVEQLMGLVAKGFKPAKRSELSHTDKATWPTDDEGEARDPWQLTNWLVFENQKTKQFYTYSTSSRGGITALGELAKDYSAHCRQTPDEYPIVALDRGSYRHPHRQIGEVRFPIFKRVGWTARGPVDDRLGTVTGGQDDGGNGSAALEPPTNAEPAGQPMDEAPTKKPAASPARKAPPAAPRI
jgi:hypothetical protein